MEREREASSRRISSSGSRLNIELQNSRRAFGGGFVTKGGADFFAGFANAREHDAIAGNTNAAEVIEFTGGDNVEAAATLREQLQNRKIAVGLDGETYAMRNRRKPVLQFVKGIRDGAAAVNVRREYRTDSRFPVAKDLRKKRGGPREYSSRQNAV